MSLLLERIGGWWLEGTLRGAVLLSLALALAWLLRRRPAAERHFVLAAGLLGALAVPFLHPLLPDVRWAVLPSQADVADVSPRIEIPALEPAPAAIVAPADPAPLAFVVDSPGAASPAPAAWTPPGPLALASGLWILGCLVLGLRRWRAERRLQALERETRPLDNPVWEALTEAIAEDYGIRRPVRLVVHPDAVTPATWGVRRPLLLLPPDAATWSVDRRRATLLHELAHVRRADALVHRWTGVARDLHWCNPFAWWTARELGRLREQACDDAVLNAGARPSGYAGVLLDLARRQSSVPVLSATGLVPGRGARELELRIHHILRAMRRSHLPRGPVAFASAAFLALVSLPALALDLVPQEAAPAAQAKPVQEREATPAPRPVPEATPPRPARRPAAQEPAPEPQPAPPVRRVGGPHPPKVQEPAPEPQPAPPVRRVGGPHPPKVQEPAPEPQPAPPVRRVGGPHPPKVQEPAPEPQPAPPGRRVGGPRPPKVQEPAPEAQPAPPGRRVGGPHPPKAPAPGQGPGATAPEAVPPGPAIATQPTTPLSPATPARRSVPGPVAPRQGQAPTPDAPSQPGPAAPRRNPAVAPGVPQAGPAAPGQARTPGATPPGPSAPQGGPLAGAGAAPPGPSASPAAPRRLAPTGPDAVPPGPAAPLRPGARGPATPAAGPGPAGPSQPAPPGPRAGGRRAVPGAPSDVPGGPAAVTPLTPGAATPLSPRGDFSNPALPGPAAPTRPPAPGVGGLEPVQPPAAEPAPGAPSGKRAAVFVGRMPTDKELAEIAPGLDRKVLLDALGAVRRSADADTDLPRGEGLPEDLIEELVSGALRQIEGQTGGQARIEKVGWKVVEVPREASPDSRPEARPAAGPEPERESKPRRKPQRPAVPDVRPEAPPQGPGAGRTPAPEARTQPTPLRLPPPIELSRREAKLPRVILHARSRTRDDYVRATFNFRYATRDDVKLVRNNWDLYLTDHGKLQFQSRIVTDDVGGIADLGPVDLATVTSNPAKLAGHTLHRDLPVQRGHTYVVYSKDTQWDYWAAFRVVGIHVNGQVEIAWRLLHDDSGHVHGFPTPKRDR